MRTAAIAVLAIVASLLAIMNMLQTAGYTARVPEGANAMGLVVPLFASIVAAVCLLAATSLALAGGRLAWIDARTTVAATSAIVAALGIGIMMVCAFIGWAERWGSWIAPVGLIGAGLAPVAVTVLLLLSRAPVAGQSAAAPFPRSAIGLLAPVALAGFLLGAFGVVKAAQSAAQNAARTTAAATLEQSKLEKQRNRTPSEVVRESLAALDSTAPLWTVIASLPDVTDAATRNTIVERALSVPNLRDDLAQTIVGKYPRYRHGCLLFMQYVGSEQRSSNWNSLIVEAINVSVREMTTNGDWLEPDEIQNPHPVDHVRAMRDAAALFPNQPDLMRAMDRLKAAVPALRASAKRDSAMLLTSSNSGN